jgi:hypothetical protein
MANSEKNPGNLASLFTFLFDKSPLYESHWIIFGRQVAKNSGKIFILKKKKTNAGLLSAAESRQVLVVVKRVFISVSCRFPQRNVCRQLASAH